MLIFHLISLCIRQVFSGRSTPLDIYWKVESRVLQEEKWRAIRPRWAPSERSRIESIAMATGGWEAATCAAGVQKSERPAVGEQVACV